MDKSLEQNKVRKLISTPGGKCLSNGIKENRLIKKKRYNTFTFSFCLHSYCKISKG